MEVYSDVLQPSDVHHRVDMVSRGLKDDRGILSTLPECFNYCRSIISYIAAAGFHSARFGLSRKRGGCSDT